MSKRILVIASSHPELGGEPNGTYLPELTHAVEALEDAGLDWDLVSVDGGEIPYYGADGDETTRKMLADDDFARRIGSTAKLSTVDAEGYDAVFYPGGYGLLFDLVDNEASQRIAGAIHDRGGVVAAVCHGPAALSGVKRADGSLLVADREVTGFTRQEEVAGETLEKVPFLVGERLMEAGAIYSTRAAWETHVVQSDRLITGQNPGSARAVGQALAAMLGAERGR